MDQQMMNMQTGRQIRVAAALLAVAVFAGCAQGLGGATYSRDEARREQNVRMGVVESVRQVQIEGTRTPIGPAAGAVVGGIAGSTVGGGRGSDIATVLGAVAGGEESARREKGGGAVPAALKLHEGYRAGELLRSSYRGAVLDECLVIGPRGARDHGEGGGEQ